MDKILLPRTTRGLSRRFLVHPPGSSKSPSQLKLPGVLLLGYRLGPLVHMPIIQTTTWTVLNSGLPTDPKQTAALCSGGTGDRISSFLSGLPASVTTTLR